MVTSSQHSSNIHKCSHMYKTLYMVKFLQGKTLIMHLSFNKSNVPFLTQYSLFYMETSANSSDSRFLPLYFWFMGGAILDVVSCQVSYLTLQGLGIKLKSHPHAINPDYLNGSHPC